jgi:hypothetical protein
MMLDVPDRLREVDRTLGLSKEPASLRFDGSFLHWDQGAHSANWPAHSGIGAYWEENDYSLKAQRDKGKGPLPEGVYQVARKFQIRPPAKEIIPGIGPQWKGGMAAFGNGRVELIRIHNTAPLRYGFFIHGGTRTGSQGCIKIMNPYDLSELALRLAHYGRDIYLEVKYPKQFGGGHGKDFNDIPKDYSIPVIPELPGVDITKDERLQQGSWLSKLPKL